MKTFLITGSSGLVGKALKEELIKNNCTVRTLVRREPKNEFEFKWNIQAQEIDLRAIEGIDAVIHLAGENIADEAWTDAKKDKILRSRIDGTKLVSDAIAAAEAKPKVFISASAVGIYGSNRDEIKDESSRSGTGFLAEVCRQWETATISAEQAGVRVVHLRIGIVLSKDGGALSKMLFPFSIGIGGTAGPGTQYMSWISLDDLIGVILHAAKTETISGPVNAVSPNPSTNREFTSALGKALRRPTLFPLPSLALKIVFGEMAKDTILSSIRCEPGVLKSSKYKFKHPELGSALRAALSQ